MMSLVARAAVVVAVLLSSVADAAANVEASTTASPFTWITLGDWGGATLNGGKKANSQDYQVLLFLFLPIPALLAPTHTTQHLALSRLDLLCHPISLLPHHLPFHVALLACLPIVLKTRSLPPWP
jgi:hypothetical protein